MRAVELQSLSYPPDVLIDRMCPYFVASLQDVVICQLLAPLMHLVGVSLGRFRQVIMSWCVCVCRRATSVNIKAPAFMLNTCRNGLVRVVSALVRSIDRSRVGATWNRDLLEGRCAYNRNNC